MLSIIALGILPLSSLLNDTARGTWLREVLAAVLAVGVCAAILGLGLGLWLAVRIRRLTVAGTALFAAVVALAWWIRVFVPLIAGTSP